MIEEGTLSRQNKSRQLNLLFDLDVTHQFEWYFLYCPEMPETVSNYDLDRSLNLLRYGPAIFCHCTPDKARHPLGAQLEKSQSSDWLFFLKIMNICKINAILF